MGVKDKVIGNRSFSNLFIPVKMQSWPKKNFSAELDKKAKSISYYFPDTFR